ncbi:MAG: AbrB family transcriptional regulator [Nitrospirae bacterium CG18_big_fil_WC_8_21_14_2_50_70_55]|nr:MAG: AbrB family transcriptional regulator [Nitrospirae bacterium CG18_big_fil_WC_8_21_14_2_50_70_55]PIU79736.1 MAG: AbrB family transcriptional regulator [Nitrospirae bacterium CG06_land_8_20_14_3_00_70_43]PIW83427.1 MAG: AbrB family transcriptional regulator [Nitrospirae bacterium CG_4_8_14_3_um_filter_70_85]PIX84324.1 MAG: AbrB family transcriptional regulator [Nitrospirae bacterium CG_4_10_14_3_um_filter_70_108]
MGVAGATRYPRFNRREWVQPEDTEFNMATVKTSGKGQVVLPKMARDRLGILPGSLVEVTVVGDHLEIRPLPADPITALRGTLSAKTSLAKGLIEDHRREVKRGG